MRAVALPGLSLLIGLHSSGRHWLLLLSITASEPKRRERGGLGWAMICAWMNNIHSQERGSGVSLLECTYSKRLANGGTLCRGEEPGTQIEEDLLCAKTLHRVGIFLIPTFRITLNVYLHFWCSYAFFFLTRTHPMHPSSVLSCSLVLDPVRYQRVALSVPHSCSP